MSHKMPFLIVAIAGKVLRHSFIHYHVNLNRWLYLALRVVVVEQCLSFVGFTSSHHRPRRRQPSHFNDFSTSPNSLIFIDTFHGSFVSFVMGSDQRASLRFGPLTERERNGTKIPHPKKTARWKSTAQRNFLERKRARNLFNITYFLWWMNF